MNILYFLEPSIEQGDLWFRFSTFKSLIVPEIKALKDSGGEVKVLLAAASHVVDQYRKEYGDIPADEVLRISLDDLEKVFGSKHDIPIKLKRGEADSSELKSYAKLFEDGLCESPDVVVTYESINYHLKQAFPEALHLNAMFGAFSRAPFPSMLSLDFEGVYDESYLYKNREKIKTSSEKVASSDLITIKNLRRMANKSLSSQIPIKEEIYNIKKCFDSLVLLPLQVDGHLSFVSCTSYDSHYEMVEDALKNLPSSVGLLVTEHSYRKNLTSDQVNRLSRDNPNFIYYENSQNVPSVSQFLLPYVNGVIAVSSSLGYQAALWQKPLYICGSSQLSVLETADSYDAIVAQVMQKRQIDRDGILAFIYNKFNFFYKHDMFESGKALDTYRGFYEHFKRGDLHNAYQKNIRHHNKINRSQSAERGWLLKKEISDNKLRPYPDYLRLGYSLNKAVSYDLFDTLAERDFVNPHELFLLVEIKVRELLRNKNFNFSYFRREAEKDVRRPTKGDYEITLDQIYVQFKELTGLTSHQCETIKDLEVEAEVALIHPKRFMIENYHFSRILVDSVSIISDIYLEESVVEKVAKSIGAYPFDLLYSSASEKTRKHNGSIYPQYIAFLKDQGIDKNKALHVGDNDTADGKMAKLHGLKVYVKPKAIDNFKRSKIGEVMQGGGASGALSTSVLNGVIANKFYGVSYNKRETDTLFQGSKYQFGYSALGPLVYGFTQKLLRRVKQAGYTDVFFLARDGWLLKEAFDKVSGASCGSIETHYLYASRRAAMVASIKGWDDIAEVASQSFNAQSIESFLYARFGVVWDEEVNTIASQEKYRKNDIVSPYAEQKKLFSFLRSLKDKILNNSKDERESYLDYLKEVGFLGACKNRKPLLVDIGYSGSMQYYIKRMLDIEVLDGFYLLTHHHARNLFKNDLFEGYLSDTDDHRTPYRHKLNDFVFLFESCLSSPEGSLLRFSGKGASREMHLLGAEDEAGRITLLRSVHRGASDFVHDIVNRFLPFVQHIEFSPAVSERIILNLFKNPNGKDAEIFRGVEVENVFGGGSVYLISSENPNFGIEEEVDNFLAVSKWKEGAKAWLSYVSSNQGSGDRPSPGYKNVALVEKSNKKIYKDVASRKRAKLKNNPYMYFYDIRNNPSARSVRHVFDSRFFHGRVMRKLIKRVVK